ncbi:MAG: ABC transporter substrate-binding protein [Bacteroidales bacterium]|nr:ABC transporter substrate-binding protein [Bacteroidales bacterium]
MNLKIGILTPHSNALPTMGRDFIDGLEMALANTPVELFVEGIGIGADMKQIIASVQKLQNQHRVHIITGLLGHHLIGQLLGMMENLGSLMLYSDLGARLPIGLKKTPTVFCNSFDLCLSAFLSAKCMIADGHKQIAVSSCYYEAGYGFTQALEKGLYGSGGEFAGHFITPHIPRENEAEIMNQFMESTKPSAIYAQYSGIFAREHASFLSQNNISGQYPLYVSPFAVENSLLNDFPGIFDDTRCVNPWMVEDENKANLQFVAGYTGLYDRQPSIFSLLGYENGKALATMANSVSKYTVAELKKALETINFDSPRGTFGFHPDTHRTSFGQSMWKIISENGTYKKHKMMQFENDPALTLEWMNMENMPVGGWFNAYLCQ